MNSSHSADPKTQLGRSTKDQQTRCSVETLSTLRVIFLYPTFHPWKMFSNEVRGNPKAEKCGTWLNSTLVRARKRKFLRTFFRIRLEFCSAHKRQQIKINRQPVEDRKSFCFLLLVLEDDEWVESWKKWKGTRLSEVDLNTLMTHLWANHSTIKLTRPPATFISFLDFLFLIFNINNYKSHCIGLPANLCKSFNIAKRCRINYELKQSGNELLWWCNAVRVNLVSAEIQFCHRRSLNEIFLRLFALCAILISFS